MIASSDNNGGVVLLCVEQNVAGSNLALYFNIFFSLFEIFLSSCRISVHNKIHNYYYHARAREVEIVIMYGCPHGMWQET